MSLENKLILSVAIPIAVVLSAIVWLGFSHAKDVKDWKWACIKSGGSIVSPYHYCMLPDGQVLDIGLEP